MKTLHTLVIAACILMIPNLLSGQRIGNLHGINYQAVAIDDHGKEIVGMDIEGKPLYEKEIGVKFSITKGESGEVQYSETHSTITDQYGLFSLVIGKGSQTGGGQYTHLLDIPWIDADQWLKVEISINNDGNYKLTNYQQFMTVPYSFYTDDIADDAITTEKILNETILAEDIAEGAVTTTEILNETILAEDIAEGAVTTIEILNETILAEDIAEGAVTTSEILNGTILTEDIASGAITSEKILDATIVNDDIADNTIDLTAKVTSVLPLENGGTGRSVVNQGDILIGSGAGALDTLAVNDSMMVFSDINGNTELFKLRAGPRTFLSIDPVTKTVTISAVDQSGGPNTGTAQVSVGNIASLAQQERNFPSEGVQPGDIILATTLENLQGITLTAYVRQAGQVNVIFFNGTGQTVPLGIVNVQFANFGQP